MTQLDPTSPVNVLADRFWEAILAEEPTTATMYGDERYADRLEDPSPAGRARRRALRQATQAEAAAIDPSEQGLEDRITLDMIRVVCALGLVQDDQRTDLLRVVDQMAGPQTLLPQVALFQAADTPERLERFEARLRAYEGYMAANRELLREGIATGLPAPRIVAERTIAQLCRLLGSPLPIDHHDRGAGRRPGRSGSDRAARPRRDHPGRPGLPRGAPRGVPGRQPAGAGPVVRPERRRPVPDPDPRLDHARHRSPGGPPDRPRGARVDRGGATGDLAVPGFRRRHGRLPGGARGGPGERDGESRGAAGPRPRGHRPGPRPRPRYFAGCRGRGCECAPSSSRRRTARSPNTSAHDRRLAPRELLRQHVRLPTRLYSKLGSTTYHEAVPGRPQIALEMENEALNVFRRLGSRLVGGAYVGLGPVLGRLADEMGLFRNEAERFGCSTRRPGGRPGSSSTTACTPPLAAPALDRLPPVGWPVRDGRGHRDGSLHLLARPGAHLQARPAPDQKLRAGSLPATRRLRPARLPDAVLGHGSLPLATLARELPNWVATPA